MKTKLIFLSIMLGSYFCGAQNYQCLQNGAVRYFINGNNYLRGIRMDSVQTFPDSTVYYLFHTPRGAYDPSLHSKLVLDPDGGSWAGKRVVQLTNGTFIFDSYWGDSTVIIKTQANVGDSWVFYKDTGKEYYIATVAGQDTMTILSTIDSVKTIKIDAYNDAGMDLSDSLDNFEIILSKNNGFAQMFDLYTFPYHKPDSAYRLGLDYVMDKSTFDRSAVPVSPNKKTAVFKLIDFINPNDQQLHNWNTGDIITSMNSIGIPIYGPVDLTILQDTVTDKTVSGHIMTVTLSGTSHYCPLSYPCSLICSAGIYGFSDSNYPILDLMQVPEDTYHPGNDIYYYPDDTNNCLHSPAYASQLPTTIAGLGSVGEQTTYKLGIGKTEFHHSDGEPTFETDQLIYYSIQGNKCGTPLAVAPITREEHQVSVYPNPAKTELTISSQAMINRISINNLVGQTVFCNEYNSTRVQVNITGLANGIYFIKINGTDVKRFVKE